MILACLAVFLSSLFLTYMTKRFAVNNQIIDLPNERSSHFLPTPRGGGIAIVITFTAVCMVLYHFKQISLDLYYALTVGGLIIAAVGALDDIYHLSSKIRLFAHFGVAIWALYWLHGFPNLDLGTWTIHLGMQGSILATFAIVWLINLYNFMDGIDGIAGIEGLFIACASAAALLILDFNSYAAIMMLFAAAIFGFTVFNWPPAKIFMGDVGSGYCGYIFAVLGIATANKDALPLTFWLIILGVFICDATFTVINRTWHGKRFYHAHREHAYQHLNICGLSHKDISLSILFVNCFILLPLAFESLVEPKKAFWFLIGMIVCFLATWIYIKRLPSVDLLSEV